MDIQPAMNPAAAAKTAAAGKSDSPQDGGVSAPAFSQLLRGLKTEGTDAMTPLQALADGAAGVDGGALNVLAGALGADGLVGQTQRLDLADADLALQDGSFLLAQQEAGLMPGLAAAQGWGAQPHMAAGQSVATVAAGVQAAVPVPVDVDASRAMVASAATLTQASDAVDAALQSAVDSALGEDVPSEGRVALHGAWTLQDPQMSVNPAFQRVLGQVEQWAAASAGLQPKPNERAEGVKTAAMGAELQSADSGAGTRLMENAVKATPQAHDAAFDAPEQAAPVQDMRFWLQGKQQRAEVVLDKDGQTVRVQVMVRGNEAHVTFRADEAQTRGLLDASLEQLRAMLEQQGVALAGVSVQAQDSGGQSPQGQSPRNPWDSAPVQHGQVVVPVADAAEPQHRSRSAQALDLYA
jgi:flagellar hook-length control protein FliK